MSPVITVPAAPRAGRGEGPGAVLFPKLLFPACWAVTMENQQPGEGGGEPLGSAGCGHPGIPLRDRRVPERGRGLAGSGPGGAGPGGGRSPVCARPPEHGEGRSSAFVLGRPSPDKRLPPAPRGSGQGCPGLLAWEMRGLQREPPRHRSPCAVGRWVLLVPPHTSRLCPHRQGWRSHCGLWEVPGQGAVLAAPRSPLGGS